MRYLRVSLFFFFTMISCFILIYLRTMKQYEYQLEYNHYSVFSPAKKKEILRLGDGDRRKGYNEYCVLFYRYLAFFQNLVHCYEDSSSYRKRQIRKYLTEEKRYFTEKSFYTYSKCCFSIDYEPRWIRYISFRNIYRDFRCQMWVKWYLYRIEKELR